MSNQLTWFNFTPDTMPEDLQAKLKAWQAAEDAAVKVRKDFEAAFIAKARKAKKIGEEETIVFSFGKLRQYGTFGMAVKKLEIPAAEPTSTPKAKKSFF